MAKQIVDVKNVSFSYGDSKVLDDVTFSITNGDLCALVGPNGSGKSTLIKCITGLLTPQHGDVDIAKDESDKPIRIGYVEQRKFFSLTFPLSVREIVSSARTLSGRYFFGLKADDKKIVDHAIESVGLEQYANTRIDKLSGGQVQRVLIAKAFASEPDFLILDEPTAGVDSQSQKLFRDSIEHIISEHKTTVLLVSHELSAVADLINHIVVLKKHVVFDGSPEELKAKGISLGIHEHDLPIWLERMDVQ